MMAKVLQAAMALRMAVPFGLAALWAGFGLAEEEAVPGVEEEAVAAAETPVEDADGEPEGALMEEVVVTGSRIRRNEFNTISPVQIILGQRSRELGMVDTASMIQGSTAASGIQIDNTFNAFVLDNGPGAANVNLRGLDATRTLLLVNSRRMSPAGVGGAPTAPDLNSIPSIMIDRVEVLNDGASSVYGSDAVAGVINILMRQQFEGLEFEADYVLPEVSEGGEIVLSAAWGRDFDRGSFGVGAEFYDRERLAYKDREHTRECDRYFEIDENGTVRNDDPDVTPGTTINSCKLRTRNWVWLIGHPMTAVWSTPGTTNIGIPNFSETVLGLNFARFNPTINPVDTDGDGVPDIGIVDPDGNGRTEVDIKADPYNYNGSDWDRSGDYVAGLRRFNLYSFGNYELQDANNTSLFFELLYNQRESESFAPGPPIFFESYVPATNPYNPCNQAAPGGVNCWAFFIDPDTGIPLNYGSVPTYPVFVVRGDRDQLEVQQDQVRAVGGVEGDLPWGTGWSYEAFGTHSWSRGVSSRAGILEAPLFQSVYTSTIDPATGNIVCGEDSNGDGVPDGQGCVPVNVFAESLYQAGAGDFATQAERDFLFGVREFETVFEQTVLGLIVQGDVARLPWNDIEIPLVLGLEYRKDMVDSQPNDVARDGLLFGFFSDRGAKGSRNLKEAYVETEFRLFEGKPLADELVFNLSGRYTEESTYGSRFTHSVKMRYSPVEALDFRASRSTSFRAPNAREQFLLGQSGFPTLYDPCVVPIIARVGSVDPRQPPTYDPSEDTRTQQTLDNCRAQGVDPTALGLATGFATSYSVEVFNAGGETLQATVAAEDSTATNAGIVFRQPWFEDFDLSVSGTYWRIEVEDSIAQLSAQSFVQDCYVDRSVNDSTYCRFITRGSNGLLESIDSSYFNIHEEVAAGWDWNLLYEQSVVVNDRNLDLALDIRATRNNQLLFVLDETREDSTGRTFVPVWNANLTAQAEYGDFRLTWRTAYQDGGEEQAEEFEQDNDTCFGLGIGCRPLNFTKSSVVHTASFTWSPGDWRVTLGVRNIFDEGPQLLDDDAPYTQVNNVPIGVYGLNHHVGRSYFAGVSRTLGLLAGRARGY